MRLFQLTGEGVNVLVREFRFAGSPHDVQNVRRPVLLQNKKSGNP
jgi:hypothetical protein